MIALAKRKINLASLTPRVFSFSGMGLRIGEMLVK
jgi:hypothetical protein